MNSHSFKNSKKKKNQPPNTLQTSQQEQFSSAYMDATDPNDTVYKRVWKNPN